MNILIADDHALLRKGLIQLLADEYPDAHFGEASTTPKTLELLSQCSWNLLILDIFMPGRSGLEVLSEVKQKYAAVPVLVLSSTPEDQMAVRVLKAGASGYLNKQTAPENLILAARKILEGGRYISASTAELLAAEFGEDIFFHDRLSDREYAVMQLLISGKTLSDVASELSLSPKTVSTYHTRIWEKLHVKNDVEMVRYAIEHKLSAFPS